MSKCVGQSMRMCLTGLIVLVLGCQPGANLKYNQGMSTGVATKNNVSAQKVAAKPYTGNIELKFDTALLKGYKGPHKVVPFSTFSTKSKSGFKTQNLEPGPQVWQSEVLTRTTGQPNEFDLTFSAPVGTYFLRVHNGDEQEEHRISSATVSLNGAVVSVPDDYSQQVALVQKTVQVTTGGTQQVHVRLASKPGSFLKLEVLATIAPTPSPTPTPDPLDPVFDPADPSSLGDLYPDVPGNQNIPDPETFDAVISLNDEPPSKVANGQVFVQIKEPVAQNLAAILAKYNGTTVFGPIDRFYMLQVDMTRIDLSLFADNLRQLNATTSEPRYIIQKASFANIESARTLALVTELFTSGLIDSVNFDPVMTTATPSPQPIGAMPSKEQDSTVQVGGMPGRTFSPHAQNSWWLNEQSTRVTEAWKSSMGLDYNRGLHVNVAVIDQGFAGLYRHMQPGEDLEGQIRTDLGKRISINRNAGAPLDWDTSSLQAEDNNIKGQTEHGTQVASTIVAKINNNKGISGVAPHAKVVPYKVGHLGNTSWGDVAFAMYYIYVTPYTQQLRPQVVNISMWNSDSAASDFMQTWANNYSIIAWNALINIMVNALSDQKIVVVACAGNGGWPIDRNFPAGPGIPGVIAVGALEDTQPLQVVPGAQDLQRAVFREIPIDQPEPVTAPEPQYSTQYASNWEPKPPSGAPFKIPIWAPGDNMATNGIVKALDGTVTGVAVGKWSGTSAATPVVAGVVALMKAINPNLTVQEIKTILTDTAYTKNYNNDAFLRTYPSPVPNSSLFCGSWNGYICGAPTTAELSLKILNAKDAVATVAGSTQPLAYQGYITSDGTFYHLQTTNLNPNRSFVLAWNAVTSSAYLNTVYIEDVSTAQPLQYVQMSTLTSTTPVQVEGFALGGSSTVLDVHRIRKIKAQDLIIQNVGPTPPPDKSWTVKAFNVNDRVNVIINGNHVISNLGAGQSQEIAISQYMSAYPTSNTIQFQAFNDSNSTPGYAWGFELKADGQVVYRDIRGHAGVLGARNNDPSFGPQYDQAVVVHKNGVAPGQGEYWAKAYNANDINQMLVNGQQVLQLGPNAFGSSEVMIDGSIQLLQNNALIVKTLNDGGNFSWGFDVYRGDFTLLYRNRDGERENLSTLPAGARFNSTTGCCGIEVLNEVFNFFDLNS